MSVKQETIRGICNKLCTKAMTTLFAFAPLLFVSLPTLADVEAKVKVLPGVEIFSEMVSPSVVPVHFKCSPEGYFWAKYPSSEDFVGPKSHVTWIPDRREYSEQPNEPGNPLPVGFDALWPGKPTYRQTGPTEEARFHERDCYKIPCKGDAGYTIQLYVDRATLLPRGTRVELNGTTHEMVHKTVNVRKMPAEWLQFKKPADARPAGKFDPTESLIKPGTSIGDFTAADTAGRKTSLKGLMKGKSGLVLNFWFSACTGCVAEMPFMVALKPKIEKSNIGLIGVNAIDGVDFARRTSKLNRLPYPTLVGDGASHLTKKVGIGAYPVTLVVDKNRKVVDAIMGFDEARLTKALKSLGYR